ncbi:ABC transporter permease subunit [Bacillus timonensis]|nr:ABC transporter permease subunit [Bacillus timonensis]
MKDHQIRKQFTFHLLVLVLISPVFLLVMKSISYSWKWGELLPGSFHLRGWNILLNEPRFYEAIANSLLIGFVVIALNFVIAIPAGKVLAFIQFKGKAMVELLFTLPILVPSLAVAMGVHITMIRVGAADHWFGVALVHLIPTVPYSIKIFHSAFERLGPQWEEQAVTLGATKFYSFYAIYLPQLVASVRASLFLIVVISLSQFVLTALIGGGNVLTLAMLYFPYLSSVDDAAIASFSIVFAVIPLFVVVTFEVMLRGIVPYKKRWR